MVKKISKLLFCVLLSLSIILSGNPVLMADTDLLVFSDPFEQMIDAIPVEIVNLELEMPYNEDMNELADNLMSAENPYYDKIYPTPDPDAGKVERFIVKLKPGKENSFKNKVTNLTKKLNKIGE